MVKMQDDLVLVENRFANIAEGFDGQWRGIVVTHDVVHVQQ